MWGTLFCFISFPLTPGTYFRAAPLASWIGDNGGLSFNQCMLVIFTDFLHTWSYSFPLRVAPLSPALGIKTRGRLGHIETQESTSNTVLLEIKAQARITIKL